MLLSISRGFLNWGVRKSLDKQCKNAQKNLLLNKIIDFKFDCNKSKCTAIFSRKGTVIKITESKYFPYNIFHVFIIM